MQLRTESISIFHGFERPALVIAVVARMLVGLGFAISLILRVYMMVLTDLRCDPAATSLGNLIRCTDPVEAIAAAIVLLAGIGLAAGFFSPRPIPLIETLTMLMAAVVVRFVGGITAETATWQLALVILALFAAFSSVYLLNGLRHTGFLGKKTSEDAEDHRP